MSTWSKQPPTDSRYNLWRINADSPETNFTVLELVPCNIPYLMGGDNHGFPAIGLGGEWLRLIPADEAERRVIEAVAVEIEKFEAERQKWRAEVGKAYDEGLGDYGMCYNGKEGDFPTSRARRVAMGEEEPTL